jgi:hypothetical protein
MALQADAGHVHAAALEFFNQSDRAFTLGFVLEGEVIVIQFCRRVRLVCELKSFYEIIFPNDL